MHAYAHTHTQKETQAHTHTQEYARIREQAHAINNTYGAALIEPLAILQRIGHNACEQSGVPIVACGSSQVINLKKRL